ncbi:hypothetical protein CANARDRAFT_8815 [[Candida] arabinofermentans NRRL YB-2248]|uniref:AAA+ ATPase domain-containing protein n=1 Tax=[Candida] arabinofermentans NRRL YB-2248 TaxID=983967 RepID=A0A1E4SXD4_9ASCO|nr:hypothetical protein CANARDRAFT_8815 [[Candida] arabinofermentans NRRL YB-2248]
MTQEAGLLGFSLSNSLLFGKTSISKSVDSDSDSDDSDLDLDLDLDHVIEKDKVQINYNRNIVIAKSKDITLSSGKRITIKPKESDFFKNIQEKEEEEEDEDISHGLGLIDIDKLYKKLQIDEKIAEQESKQPQVILKDTFGSKKNSKGMLWVDKYKPSNFLDLIGNERTNRDVLHWLNQWNEIVFNKPNPQLVHKYNNNFGEVITDPFNRPFKKILLIHGAPGLGKTSIAYTASLQLNYKPFEINSSDERTGLKIKEKIKGVLTSDDVTKGKGERCLILDEIDGVEHGFINVLLDLLTTDKKMTQQLQNGGGDLKKSKKDMKGILKRPIIAICNDIYSPVLERLKPYCEIVSFRKPPLNQLKNKLKKISSIEKLSGINDRILDDIINGEDGDLRGCINWLQFHGENISDNNNSNANGLKDGNVNWFSVVKNIFTRNSKYTKSEIFNNLESTLNKVNNNGQIDKIIQGCFNGYINHLNHIEGCNKLDEWLWFYDSMNNKFGDELYDSTVAMWFYWKFNELGDLNERGTFIKYKNQENYEMKKIVNNLLKKFDTTIGYTNIDNLLNYELSLICNIIVPNINVSHMSDEKLKVSIELINDYNLRLENVNVNVNESGGGGGGGNGNRIEFNPPIEIFSKFTNLQNGVMMKLRNQVISNYVMREKSKEMNNNKRKLVQDKGTKEQESDIKKKMKTYGSSAEYFKSKYNELTSVINSGNNSEEKGSKIMNKNENRIWVKYHEGFSNAVRKELTYSELIS